MLRYLLTIMLTLTFSMTEALAQLPEKPTRVVDENSTNWWIFVGVTVVLVLIVLAAAFFPPRRDHRD